MVRWCSTRAAAQKGLQIIHDLVYTDARSILMVLIGISKGTNIMFGKLVDIGVLSVNAIYFPQCILTCAIPVTSYIEGPWATLLQPQPMSPGFTGRWQTESSLKKIDVLTHNFLEDTDREGVLRSSPWRRLKHLIKCPLSGS